MVREACTVAVKERPIPFYEHEVRATLDGRKGQFRRVVKGSDCWGEFIRNTRRLDANTWRLEGNKPIPKWLGNDVSFVDVRCPYGKPGDLLWVRETWCVGAGFDKKKPSAIPEYATVWYKAGGVLNQSPPASGMLGDCRWRPSIHMPRWASRIALRVTDVRVEWVREVSEEDAQAEGVDPWFPSREDLKPFIRDRGSYRNGFRVVWDSINAKRGYGWDGTPWVWVVEFEIAEVSNGKG